MQTQILGEPTWPDLGAEGIPASNDQDEQVGVICCWAMEGVGVVGYAQVGKWVGEPD